MNRLVVPLIPGLALAWAVLTPTAEAGVVTSYNINQMFVDNETSGSPTNPTAGGRLTIGYTLDPTQPAIGTENLVHTTAFAGTANLQGYYINNSAIVPAVVGNVSDHAVHTSFGVDVQPGQLLLHPGGLTSDAYAPPIAFADLRFNVQFTGTYAITGVFDRLHDGATDVHVYVNGVSVFDSNLDPGHTSAAFGLQSGLLSAGARIDFLVGPGPDGNIGSDSTGLYASVVATPEPSTLASAGIAGLCGLGIAQRHARMRKAAR